MLMLAIESIKAQTYDNFEIIVVNDASLDPRYYNLIEDVMVSGHFKSAHKKSPSNT